MAASKIAENLDILIIGSSLGGVFRALAAERLGLRVGLVDSQDELGGVLRPHIGPDAQNLDRFPMTLGWSAQTEAALTLLRQYIPDLQWEIVENPVRSWDSGQFRDFLGFGAKIPVGVEVWDTLITAKHIRINMAANKIWQLCVAQLNAVRWLRSNISTYDVADSRIEAVEVNGKLWVQAQSYEFFDSLRIAADMPLGPHLPGRLRQKWTKSTTYTAVGVTYYHGNALPPELSTQAEYVLLQGGGEDLNPCLGVVEPQRSIWLGLMPVEATEDYDQIYQELKKIKRLVKRSFPDVFGEGFKEVVVVQRDSHGWLTDTNNTPVKVAGLDNLSVHSPQLWTGSPFTQALLSGFSQNLCAQPASVLTDHEA